MSNSAFTHAELLARAEAEHDRVRELAIRAYENDGLRHEQELLAHRARQEEERLSLEYETRELMLEVRRLKAEKAPPLPPSPPPHPAAAAAAHASLSPPAPPFVASEPQAEQRPQQTAIEPSTSANNVVESLVSDQQTSQIVVSQSGHLPVAVAAKSSLQPTTTQTPLQQARSEQSQGFLNKARQQAVDGPHILPGTARYVEIHRHLKKIRADVAMYGKQNPALKKETGEMRRQIRKSVGQLTEGRGTNRTQMELIRDILKSALTRIQSPPVDVSNFVLTTPTPMEGAANNQEGLPILFIYLLNIFSKAVVRQLIDEAGVKPEAADPVGVVAVSTFANEALLWRGKSLIDILIAKIRVECPVLFGLRGNEKMEDGRARIGWRRNQGRGWISDQEHYSRMTGLGAGYAAISLRDYSKSRLKNPYPPTNYWLTLASIVNTPPAEMSSTQFTVLKGLIEHYEQRFMTFYGSAARAALQVALVDFPSRSPESSSVAVSALKVLADKLKKNDGLQFNPPASSDTRAPNVIAAGQNPFARPNPAMASSNAFSGPNVGAFGGFR